MVEFALRVPHSSRSLRRVRVYVRQTGIGEWEDRAESQKTHTLEFLKDAASEFQEPFKMELFIQIFTET